MNRITNLSVLKGLQTPFFFVWFDVTSTVFIQWQVTMYPQIGIEFHMKLFAKKKKSVVFSTITIIRMSRKPP